LSTGTAYILLPHSSENQKNKEMRNQLKNYKLQGDLETDLNDLSKSNEKGDITKRQWNLN
jgi:hypothetical protein